MGIRLWRVWPALLVVGACVSVAPPAAADTYEALDDYIRDRMSLAGTPGLTYAVVSSQGVEHEGSWGVDGEGDPVDQDTAFLWGSVSKPLTALAVVRLATDGVLELDAPVVSYLPWFRLADPERSNRITVRHLLQHTSGLPDVRGVTDRTDALDRLRALVEELSETEPSGRPGERYEYASANYLVAGAVVEAVTGTSFAEHLRTAVLDPLGMQSTVTTSGEAAELLPPGHRYVFGRAVSMSTPYSDTGAAYGYVGGSLSDLARFATANLTGGTPDSLVSAADLELLHRGTVAVTETQSYGLGWRDDRNPEVGTRMVWHGGATPGFHTMVVLLPDLDRAVVVLQNAYGIFQDSELSAVGLGAARLLAGGQPAEPTGDRLYGVLLWSLGGALLLVLTLLGWSLARLVRRRPPKGDRKRRLAVGVGWLVGCAAIAAGTAVLAPAAAGGTLSESLLWSPDLGWLLVALVAAISCVGLTRFAAIAAAPSHSTMESDRDHGHIAV